MNLGSKNERMISKVVGSQITIQKDIFFPKDFGPLEDILEILITPICVRVFWGLRDKNKWY